MSTKRPKRSMMSRLLELADDEFSQVTTGNCRRRTSYSARDCLMSGLAMFNFKFPSMLKFDEQARDDEEPLHTNLQRLYGLNRVPSDTTMRRRLDEIDPQCVHQTLLKTFGHLRRNGYLARYRVYDGYLPLAVDGTGYHTSTKVRCDHCLTARTRDGKTRYRHSMLAAAVVHPDVDQAIPVCAENIVNEDGNTKQDCEIEAFKRVFKRLRKEHRGLKFIVLGDALYSVQTIIGDVFKANPDDEIPFVLSVKDKRHELALSHLEGDGFWVEGDEPSITKSRYRWATDADLNESSKRSCKVNVLEQVEVDKDGNEHRFTWVTNLPLEDLDDAIWVARLGRSRWKIENNLFKMMKDEDGYHFEHNYGHGSKHLCAIMMLLMLLAFLLDQAAALACGFFKDAWKKRKRLSYLWDWQRGVLRVCLIGSWEELHLRVAGRWRSEF